MKKLFSIPILTLSIAIFSMFFGAGNIVFPLMLGMKHQGQYIWAFLGLLLTAIGGPLLGLLAATFLEGKCKKVFFGAGKTLGLFLMITTLAMIIFIGMPRCLTISYSAINPLIPHSLLTFTIIFTAIALLCCWKHRYVLPMLGKFLSPLLLVCLIAIIYQCIASGKPLEIGSATGIEAFNEGFLTGYYTMDLVASVFFSAGIWTLIKINFKSDTKTTFKIALVSGILGCGFLALVYLGLCHSAALFHKELLHTPTESLLTTLASLALGPKLALVANIAVALACLTTVISLAMALSDIICNDLLKNKFSYHTIVIANLAIMAIMSQVGFMGLMTILHPLISICYPIVILLVLKTIYQRLFVKTNYANTLQ